MTCCCKECEEFPCCDFCIHVIRGKYGEPIGCALHLDAEHQEIAAFCEYCEDFYCYRVGLHLTEEE
jgi:hypothetical protein